MTPEANRWQRLEDLFERATGLEGAARDALVSAVRSEDADLGAELAAMLEAEARGDAFDIATTVGGTTIGAAPTAAPDLADDPLVGMRLGSWRVLHLLGHGGMGRVYLAERADGHYDQRVALKIVPASAAGAARTRFDAERRILARLSHPSIARLIDAGFTPEGSAYLVMEYVDGEPVTTYCDRHRLGVDDRLRLFRIICDATQHAHASLVVHRDLKPTNIFVSRDGQVKLLDFGIAKLLEADESPNEPTDWELRALTPSYAAPEQLLGAPVTTATDVYVLGLVLHELLTGTRVIGRTTGGRQDGSSLPAAPSACVRVAGSRDARAHAEAADRALRRGTTVERLARRLAGDLDQIVLRALRPEPDRRYASAGQLAEDIDRLLAGHPVVAQPDTLAYRARRFVGRHRLAVAVATALATAVIGFGGVAAIQANTIARERDRARLAAERAERVTGLITSLFTLADPGVGKGDSITARALLDQGLQRIESSLTGDDETQAALFGVVGGLYRNLGLYADAKQAFERVLALQQRLAGTDEGAVAETLQTLGSLHVFLNEYDQAENRLRDAVERLRHVQADDRRLGGALLEYGRALSFRGKHDPAIAALSEAVASRRRHGASDADLMVSLHEWALALHRKGDLDAALPLFREAVVIGQQIRAPSAARLEGLVHYARLVHRMERDPARAEGLYREALSLARTLHAGDHQDTAVALAELARNQSDQGRPAEAETLSRDALAMLLRLYGPQHREVMISQQSLSRYLLVLGRADEAESLARQSLATGTTLFGPGHPLSLGARRHLAELLESRGRMREAAVLREAEVTLAEEAHGDRAPYLAIAVTGLARHRMNTGAFEEAERLYRRALALREAMHPAGHARIREAQAALAECLARRQGAAGTRTSPVS